MKRYGYSQAFGIDEAPDGEYILHSDHEKAVADHAAFRARVREVVLSLCPPCPECMKSDNHADDCRLAALLRECEEP